ncbi:DUF6636 domain-containing protein [Conchiformibius kuhniae]|uniref:DUF6636 domain-containing protein n=1 Tax=Conchiformibius kuhniae TaxID=211502 RepID=A0A8T9MYW3_9NEIS|nr:DUF6636 domain-containing protein [Conchiformibius kuhniae]UOP05382.1 hypothetical protein LVJ77_04110 [Conchiformibius kuhniae]
MKYITSFLFASAVLLCHAAQADTGVTDFQGFHTQNHTVSCVGYRQSAENPSFVGCSVNGEFVKHKYKRDKDCELDWGSNFSVRKKGKAEIDCAGDTYAIGDESRLLKTGQTVRGDGWTCTAVKDNGIKCLNTQGNGFVLSKKKQMLIHRKR